MDHFTFKNMNQIGYQFIRSLEENIGVDLHDVGFNSEILQKP